MRTRKQLAGDALVLAHDGQLDEARQAAHLAALARPDEDPLLEVQALMNIAFAYAACGDRALAIDAFKRSIETGEANGEIEEANVGRFALGECLIDWLEPRDAVGVLSAVPPHAVCYAHARALLAKCYVLLEQGDDARAHAVEARMAATPENREEIEGLLEVLGLRQPRSDG